MAEVISCEYFPMSNASMMAATAMIANSENLYNNYCYSMHDLADEKGNILSDDGGFILPLYSPLILGTDNPELAFTIKFHSDLCKHDCLGLFVICAVNTKSTPVVFVDDSTGDFTALRINENLCNLLEKEEIIAVEAMLQRNGEVYCCYIPFLTRMVKWCKSPRGIGEVLGKNKLLKCVCCGATLNDEEHITLGSCNKKCVSYVEKLRSDLDSKFYSINTCSRGNHFCKGREKHCGSCALAVGKKKKCMICKKVYYCNKKCQQNDLERHRKICKK